MNKPQAKAILALLSAAFPREPMPDSTVELWSSAMLDVLYEDGCAAVEDLVQDMDRMPSMHQLKLACQTAKRDRIPQLTDTTASGPSLAEFLKDNPEYRDRVAAISDGPLRADTKISEQSPDRWEKLRRDLAKMDLPQSENPRKRRDCTDHQFITHDRCYFCGVPLEEIAQMADTRARENAR